jgi:hypothetical protein
VQAAAEKWQNFLSSGVAGDGSDQGGIGHAGFWGESISSAKFIEAG